MTVRTEMRKRATLKDVAREAGVSVMTASHILNAKNFSHASPEKRQAIEAAAARLKYRPNLNARQLSAKKNNIIGLLIDSQAPAFYHKVVTRVERLAFRQGCRLQIGMVHEDLDALRLYVDDFAGYGIENMVSMAHNYAGFGAKVPALFEPFPHVVFFEEPMTATPFPVVAVDHYHGYFRAVSGLLARGRRRVFCLRAAYHDRAFYSAQSGLRAAYQAEEIPFEDVFWWRMDYADWAHGARAGRALDELLAFAPDAVVMPNDRLMLVMLQLLRARGLCVPEDLALMSAELGSEALTDVLSFSGLARDVERLAERVFARLTEQAAPEGAVRGPMVELVPDRLVWGGTCPGEPER